VLDVDGRPPHLVVGGRRDGAQDVPGDGAPDGEVRVRGEAALRLDAAKGPPQTTAPRSRWCSWAGSRPAAPYPARRRTGHARSGHARRGRRAGAITAPPAGALRLQDGRRPSAGSGPWVVAVGHPASRRPGQAEQTTARRASVRTCVNARLTWRTWRRPAPTVGGSMADGMELRASYVLLPMYVPVHERYSRCMPQRKSSSASAARRAVVRYAKKTASREKVVLWYKTERSEALARAKAAEQQKKASSPKSSFKSDRVRMPGFVGILKGGRPDLASRAKDIVRGTNNDK
jgi:hypothetical protein